MGIQQRSTLNAQQIPGDTQPPVQALVLAGRPAAHEIRRQCAEEIRALRAHYRVLPGLAVLRIGEDPASVTYAGRIVQSFSSAHVDVRVITLPANASRAMLQAELGRLSVLPDTAGIIVQMPLPPHIDLDAVIGVLDPEKDVDGIHPVNVGRLSLGLDCYVPATPAGGMALLSYYGIPVEGKRAVVIGRSNVVGKPLAQLLLACNATVTIAHSRTADLARLVSESDIVASATGKPGLIKGHMIKPGAVVLDFGAAVVEGAMTGDVEYEAALQRASAITPVPGGTGPMTNAMLLKNTVKAIHRRLQE